MKELHFERKDRKPLTLGEFLMFIELSSIQDSKNFEKAKDKPVMMSSDEEGNEIMLLHCIDITKEGQITLWPARI